jgi:hypothetical protein
MNPHINQKNLKLAGIFLIILVILFVFASACTETAESAGERAVQGSGEGSNAASGLVGPVVAAVATAMNGNPTASAPPIPIVDETKAIPYNHMVSYLLAGDQGYQFNIGVTSYGDPVAVLIMDQGLYTIYRVAMAQSQSSFSYSSVPVVYTNVVSQQFSYTLPSQGRYYLVIVNAPILDNRMDTSLVIRPANIHVQVELIR